jgi:hypothetical protein
MLGVGEGGASIALGLHPIPSASVQLLVPTWRRQCLVCQVAPGLREGPLLAATALSLPALKELPSQGAEQKLWQMDLCEPMDLFQVPSPGAEHIPAVRLQMLDCSELHLTCWTELFFFFNLLLYMSCPLSKSRGTDHWWVKSVCAHRRLTVVPDQPIRALVHPASELSGAFLLSLLTLSPIGLLKSWFSSTPACQFGDHLNHNPLLVRQGWGWDLGISIYSQLPAGDSFAYWSLRTASLWTNETKGSLRIWGSQYLIMTEKTCLSTLDGLCNS